MKHLDLTEAIQRVVDIKLKALDKVIEDLVEPLADVGNPEKVIGKPYEQWLPEDLVRLTQIYGTGENTPLTTLIFNKEYKKLKEKEREVEG